MQINLEQAIEIIKDLPIEDYEKLREAIDKEEKSKRMRNEKLQWRLERYEKARKWLNENSGKYSNQWVCLDGDKLVAYGADALEVHKIALEQGIESPFLHHIVEEPKFYIGGW